MRDLVLIGGGEHACVVAEAVAAMGTHRLLGFVDPAPSAHADSHGFVHLGTDDALDRFHEADLCLGFGSIGPADHRLRIATALEARGFTFAVVIHPSAVISPSACIGSGTVICAGAVVQTNAWIGRHNIINTGAIVEHDVQLGDHVQLAPRATLGGSTRIGMGTFIGLHAAVRDHLRIGAFVTIGMGAAVTADLPDGTTAVGVPARIVSRQSLQHAGQRA